MEPGAFRKIRKASAVLRVEDTGSHKFWKDSSRENMILEIFRMAEYYVSKGPDLDRERYSRNIFRAHTQTVNFWSHPFASALHVFTLN
jgi:hypothetical protein